MGRDAWGTEWGCCLDAGGCLCENFCSELEAMDDTKREAVEGSKNVLSCQRKSELVLSCVCGHPCFAHEKRQEASASNTSDQSGGDGLLDGEWGSVLRQHDDALHDLCPVLAASSLTVDRAYALLDESRVALLSALKEASISRLADRQGVCNALGRARRREELERAREATRRRQQQPPPPPQQNSQGQQGQPATALAEREDPGG